MTDKTEFHYFASHAMGWVTAESEEAAIEKLLLTNTDPSWARNCLKSGEPLVFYTTRVPLASDAPYRIEWFAPQVEGCTEGKNHLVTYLTKKAYATMPDPRDAVRKLERERDEREQALFNLSYAVVTNKSFHDPDVRKSIDEAKPFIKALQDAQDEAEAEDAAVQRAEQARGA